MENKEIILQCALRLFASRGYDAVGVQELVEAASITKPTLYYYFGSKRGLLDALLAGRFETLNQRVQNACQYQGDLPLTLDRIAATFFDFASQNTDWYRMQLSMWFSPQQSEPYQAVSQFNNRQYQLIEELFGKAAQQHGNMKGRQHPYAITFLGMINTYIGMALNGYVQLNDALRYQAVHQFMHGIFS